MLAPHDSDALVRHALAVAAQLRSAYLVDVPGGHDAGLLTNILSGIQREAGGYPALVAAAANLSLLTACGSQLFVVHRGLLTARIADERARTTLAAPICCVASACRTPHWVATSPATAAAWDASLSALDAALRSPVRVAGIDTCDLPDDAVRVDAIALVGWLLEYGVLFDTTACAVAADATLDAALPRPHCLSGEPLTRCTVALTLPGDAAPAPTFAWCVPSALCSSSLRETFVYSPEAGCSEACRTTARRAQAALGVPADDTKPAVLAVTARVAQLCATTITL
mgnify:CR=1 FL=1